MVRVNGAVAVSPTESTTCTVKFAVPAAVGVPPMPPEFSESPLGNVPALTDQLYPPVPPLAVKNSE
jgi:hypothetical protein